MSMSAHRICVSLELHSLWDAANGARPRLGSVIPLTA